MPTDTVVEQGATRRFRASDFDRAGGPSPERNVPGQNSSRKTSRPARPYAGPRGRPPGQGVPNYKPLPVRTNPAGVPYVEPVKVPKPPVAPKGFGTAARRVPWRVVARMGQGGLRYFPLLREGQMLLDAYDLGRAFGRLLSPRQRIRVPSPWYVAGECLTGPPSNWDGVLCRKNTGVQGSSCISGQSVSGCSYGVGDVIPLPNNVTNTYIYWRYPTATYRGKQWLHLKRDLATQVVPLDWWVEYMEIPGVPYIGAPVDPNFMRIVPSAQPAPVPKADPSPVVDPAVEPDARSIGRNGTRRIGARKRVPPRRREREQKRMASSRRLMLWFFAALDSLSENAEIVGAFYDALPEDVRKKWACNRSNFGVDVAGQYGIDNADCKAKALWHNWHKLDFGTAVENVIKNAIQDELIGFIQRVIPRNSGSAFDDAMMQFNADLNTVLDHGVDFDLVPNYGLYPWIER